MVALNAEVYGVTAGQYDTHYSGPVEVAENETLSDFLRPHLDGKRVLDLGAGTGLVADITNPAEYVAVDCSALMLDVLKEKHPETATFVIDLDSNSFELPGEGYDVAVALFAANWFNLPAVLQSLKVSLEPGALVILHGPAPRRLKRPLVDLGSTDPVVWADKIASFTPRRLKSVMLSSGYLDVTVRGLNAVPDGLTARLGKFAFPVMKASKMVSANRHWHFAAIGRTPR